MRRIGLKRRATFLFLGVLMAAMLLLPAVIPVPSVQAEQAPQMEWLRQFGTASGDRAYGISVDATGIYVAGYTDGALPGQSNAGYADAFVRKYDASGSDVWTRQFGTDSDDRAYEIYVDSTGIYVAGHAGGTLPGQSSAGGYDAFVRKYDAGGNIVWTRQFGTDSDEFAAGLSADSTGIYVGGRTHGTLPGQSQSGDADGFVRKYDTDGNIVWTRQFGSTDYDDVYGISSDTTGIYVTGHTSGALPGQSSAGLYDVFVRKYDASGNIVWTRQFGTADYDYGWGISVDTTGVYVAGSTFGALPGQSSSGDGDAFVRKYDANGNELWTRQFGSASSDYAWGISTSSTGVYVAGGTGGALPGQSSSGGDDIFVRKYDAGGNVLWISQFGSASNDYARGVSSTSTGIYAAGFTVGTLPGQSASGGDDAFVAKFPHALNAPSSLAATPLSSSQINLGWSDNSSNETGFKIERKIGAGGTYSQIATTGADVTTYPDTGLSPVTTYYYRVRAYNASGDSSYSNEAFGTTGQAEEAPQIGWLSQFGAASNEYANDISADATGIYVAGYTGGTFLGQSSSGSHDAFVRKYDASGNIVWTRQFGSASDDNADGIYADTTGIYVAGYTWGTLPGQTNSGIQDAFVRKYDTNGNEVWTRQFGTASGDWAFGISVDSTGIYVAGDTKGTLPGQSSSGAEDVFVRKYDASGNELWTRQFGSASDDFAKGISADFTGIYVAGYTYGALPDQSSSGNIDAFVRKYDADGNVVWTRQLGTSGSDVAEGIFVDTTGIYVAGYTYGALPGQSSSGGVDAFVRKYDASGNELWTRQFGSTDNEYAYGISADATGIYVAGDTRGTLPGQSSSGDRDAYVRKYDASGNGVWTRQFGSASFDFAHGISADATGIYLAGDTRGTLPGQSGSGGEDAFVRKYNASGTEVWTRQLGAGSDDSANGISADATGIYVAGETWGTLPGHSVSSREEDAFVRKYDTSGNELWTRQFGSTSNERAHGICTDATGIYVAGVTEGTLPDKSSSGGRDAFVRKYDASGTELWTRQFGTASSDYAYSIFADATGIFVAGGTYGTLPGQSSSGNWDAFVRKYDASGSELWTHQFGTASGDYANGISVDATGIYVAGETDGILPGQSSSGGYDAFVRKYDVSGNEVWTRQFGSASTDRAEEVFADSTGIYVAGDTEGALPGQTSSGHFDAFVRKYDSDGNIVWTRQFGTDYDENTYGISASSSGIYVAGETRGTLPGQSSSGGQDAFVAKLTSGGPTPLTGITRQVNGDILPGVTITLDGTGPVVSDQNGYYEIMATTTGNKSVVAHKDGFRDQTRNINIAGLGQEFAVTCNFQGQYGLIPKAPGGMYVGKCVNLWLYPRDPNIDLDSWTVAKVVNAWLYPVQ